MSYRSLYIEMAQTMGELRVAVCDQDLIGYCCQSKDIRGFIFIKSSLTYKKKFFVLAHEIGHLFYMKKGKTFNWSKKPRTEKQANWFAMQLLRKNDIDVEEYKHFCNEALKTGKNRKKSWFEI